LRWEGAAGKREVLSQGASVSSGWRSGAGPGVHGKAHQVWRGAMKHFLWTAQQRVVAGRVLANIISRLLQMTPPQEQTMRNRT